MVEAATLPVSTSPPPGEDEDADAAIPVPPPSPVSTSRQEEEQQRPLLLRRLSSRVAAPPPPPTAAAGAAAEPPATPAEATSPAKVVKRVRFADQERRAVPCSPKWWRGLLRILLSPSERRKRLQAAHWRLENVLRGRLYLVCIVLLTIYILIGDQCRLAALPPSADPGFRVLNTLAFLLLLLEMLATGWVYEDYFVHLAASPQPVPADSGGALAACWRRLHAPSFFFWLDLLGVVLLPFDPTFISHVAYPGSPSLLATNASRLSDKGIRIVRALRATSFLRLLKYGGVPYLSCAACCDCCGLCSIDGGYGATDGEEEGEEDAAAFANISSERPRRPGANGSSSPKGDSWRSASPVEWAAGAEEEDRLATAVTASLQRKVIVGGLLLLALVPLLDYAAEDTTWAFLFSALGAVAAQGNGSDIAGFAALLANVTGPGLGLVEVDGVTYLEQPQPRLRPDETLTQVASPSPVSPLQARVVINARSVSRAWAGEGLLLTLAAVLLFWGLAASLRHDLDRLVFSPLDQMVRLVRRIARNPLAPIREPEADDGAEALAAGGSIGTDDDHVGGGGGGAGGGGGGGGLVRPGSRRGSAVVGPAASAQGLETALLLQTIRKIGALMRIGLGAAGADIISRNLMLDSAAGPQDGLDLRMAGRLVSAVFVFCDVRNFTDATECLQEEVMVFVNKIAAILHELTVRCGGAPNKNIGDAFLLIWKVAAHEENEEEDEDDEDEGDPSSSFAVPAASDPEAKTRKALAEGPQGAQAAGRALYCVLKFAVELARLHAYVCRFSSAASQRLYARLPGYRVGVGFGLHVGWAVEGPIGSAQKIDVSYVSPHVTASEYLQDLTKEYGCTLLLSEAFYHALSPAAQYNCRQVDCVRREAAASSGGGFLAEPMSLYTYDCDPELIPASASSPFSSSSRALSPPRHAQRGGSSAPGAAGSGAGAGAGRQSLDPLQSITVRPYSDAVWGADPDLQHMATKLHPNFRATWNYAMSSYLAGEWTSARRGFETALELTQGRDGPSKRLLAVLQQHGYKAPPRWAGFRELDG